MTPTACPGRDELAALGSGRLSTDRMERLAAHIDGCPRCLAALEAMGSDDALLSADRLGDPAAVARFRREMEAVGKLDHPNLVRASDAGEAGGIHFLVMDYVPGLDLSRLVRRLGPLPVADACEAIRQAAEGLEH